MAFSESTRWLRQYSLVMSGADVPGEGSPRRLTGSEAWRAHVTLFVGLAFCAVAFWFELGRAEGGNELSWAYVFEWPLLGGFAVYMWWKVLHGERSVRRRAREPGLAPEYEGMLNAWQAHQRELAEAVRQEIENEGERVDDALRDDSWP